MSQHDFTIANQTASSARSDINNALQALASNNSGSSAPSTTYASMWWYDTGLNLLKQRNEADTAWINVGYINPSTNKFEILDDTKVVNTSGTQVGILGDQSTSTWQTGTGTTESLVSPAKVRAASLEAIDEEGPIKAFAKFNGNNASVYKSKNIQSISRYGIGQYFVTFSNSLADANYMITGSCQSQESSHKNNVFCIAYGTTPTTSGFYCTTGDTGGDSSGGRFHDTSLVSFVIVG